MSAELIFFIEFFLYYYCVWKKKKCHSILGHAYSIKPTFTFAFLFTSWAMFQYHD